MATRGPIAFADVLSGAVQSTAAAGVGEAEHPPSSVEQMVADLRRLQEKNKAAVKAEKARELSGPAAAAGRAKQLSVIGNSAARGGEPVGAQARSNGTSATEPVRLPFWPDSRRGVSNDMARSALFTVRQGQERINFKGHHVAALKNLEIIYTGEELRQRDEDVLLQLLHFGRLGNIEEPVSFVARDMLQQLGWTINSRSYRELAESISRMQASSIHLVNRTAETERRYGGSLIRSFEYQTKGDSGAAQWIVTFEKRIIRLFSHVSYTQIDWEQRLSLSAMTKWLHSFYFTHQRPYPMKVATLRDLCGSSTKSLARFRQAIKQSLAELVTVGFLTSWSVDKDSDLVVVVRQLELPAPLVDSAAAG